MAVGSTLSFERLSRLYYSFAHKLLQFMNRIGTYLKSVTKTTRTILIGLAVIFVSAGVAQATATTIDTSVSTTNLTASGTLGVTGLSTLGGFITTASSTAVAAFNVTGSTTLASTTATTMKVGQTGTGLTKIVSGYCVITTGFAAAINLATTTLTYANCTPSNGTAVIAAGDRVFVQATSSLPYYVNIQAASSTTATGGLINVALVNTSTSTTLASATYAFNFWAFTP